MIEIGRRSEIPGSVLPGIKVTMHFYFMLGLVLVTSDCGSTAECGVNKSVNTNSAHICAFCETRSCAKTLCVTLTEFFVAQTVTIGEQKISPKSDFFKKNFSCLRLL